MNQHPDGNGTRILREVPRRDPNAFFSLVGTDGNGKNAFLPVGDGMLQGHLLLLGEPGAGKGNMLCHLLRNLRVNLGEKDVLVAFDPSGELSAQFSQAGDIVFADDARASDGTGEARWNLFAELADSDRPVEDAAALCGMLYGEYIRTAREPLYFTIARDWTLALIVYLLRQDDPGLRNNETLRGLIDGFDAESLREIIASLPEFRAMTVTLSDPTCTQALGAVAALQQAARELLQGRFNTVGTLGMRKTLRRRNGKVVFVCYDPQRADETGPVYAAILDQCLQEVLSRDENEGSVYLLLSDVCALPKLDHLESALRYAGPKGLRAILSLSDVQSLYARYGETSARAILYACGTVAAFRLRDRTGRAFVRDLYGRRPAQENPAPQSQARGLASRAAEPYLIEDENLTSLQTGECIVCVPHDPPFYFRPKPYRAKA